MNTMRYPRPKRGLILWLVVLATFALARSGRSQTTAVIDGGGGRQTSASYANVGSVGGASSSSAAGTYQTRHGFAGQLHELQSVVISAAQTNLNEAATQQLSAQAAFQDGSLLSLTPTNVAWSVASGPIASVSANGLATADTVYVNTPAFIRGAYLNSTGLLQVTVVDTNNDNFATYAGDGLDDNWQVFYFGLNNTNAAPTADPDGDGFTNAQELQNGTNPTLPPNPVADKALLVTVVGNGAVVRAPNQTNFTNGASATLAATPTAGSFFVGWTNGITATTNVLSFVVTQSISVTAVFDSLTNTLVDLTNQIVAEGNLLSLTTITTNATATTLHYALAGAPSGATINTNSGLVAWTPTEAQGPSTNTLLVSVTDDLNPLFSYTNLYTIAVTEVNLPPALPPIANVAVNAGQSLSITNVATDPDLPVNAITYTLLNPPAGATISGTDGILSWTPSSGQTGTNLVLVVATDSGTPMLSSTQSFQVVVSALNIAQPMLSISAPLNGVVTLTITGDTGVQYSIVATTNITDTNWTVLGTTNPSASPFTFTDTNVANLLRRYYRALASP